MSKKYTNEAMKTYKFMTVEEVVKKLLSFYLPPSKTIDFTFDTPDDVTNNCFEPSEWYGVRIINLFDEPHGILCFGGYGGGSTKTEVIYDYEKVGEIFQKLLYEEYGSEVKTLCVSETVGYEHYKSIWRQKSLFNLPCNVGDKLYAFHQSFGVLPYTIEKITINETSVVFNCAARTYLPGDCPTAPLDTMDVDIRSLGKKAFCSEKEAEYSRENICD